MFVWRAKIEVEGLGYLPEELLNFPKTDNMEGSTLSFPETTSR